MIYIYIYDLVRKGAHARGYALQLKIKHCWKLLIWNVVLCTCINEWIYSTDNFSNQAVVDFKIQSSHWKSAEKMTAKNGHPCTEWFLSLCLQTNRKHMEKQSLMRMRKTSFYTDNITSTLTIVIFWINWSRMLPCMYVGCVANSNWKLWTTKKRQHHFGITGNVACVPIHAFALHSDTGFFQQSFARNLKNISLIIWYCCNIWRPYKISNILYKTNEKAISFFIDNIQNVTWPFLSAFIFPAAWRVFVRKHQKVCCSLLQRSDVGTVVWCRTCNVRFFRSLLRLFSSFPPILVCEMKVLWKVASSRAEDLKPIFLYTAWRISLRQGNIL